MTLGHVVPAAEYGRLGIPSVFAEDCINRVLTCAGCSGFRNRYRSSVERRDVWKLKAFVALRDEVFRAPHQIALRREQGLGVFLRCPWEVSVATLNNDSQAP